jgi:hypothetical protein
VQPIQPIGWGQGTYEGGPVDGIYLASSVAGSTRVWPVTVVDPECGFEDGCGFADAHGGIEHARARLGGPGYALGAGEVCWITDRTPHEAVPAEKSGMRQFFRLVVGPISVWHSKHNTPNPLGVLPDAPVSDVDKFQALG